MIRFLLGLVAFVFVLVPAAFLVTLFGGPILGLAGVLAVPVLVALAAAALPVVIVVAVVVSVIAALAGAVLSLALFAVKGLLFVVLPIAVLGYLATRLLAA